MKRTIDYDQSISTTPFCLRRQELWMPKHRNKRKSHDIVARRMKNPRIVETSRRNRITRFTVFREKKVLTRPGGQISLAHATGRLGAAAEAASPRIGPVNGARTSGPQVNSISCERVDSIRRSTNCAVPATAEQCDHSGTSI